MTANGQEPSKLCPTLARLVTGGSHAASFAPDESGQTRTEFM